MDMDLSSMWLPELEIGDEVFMNYNDNLSCDSFSPDTYTENASAVDEQVTRKFPSSQKACTINKIRSQTSNPFVAPAAASLSSSAFTISFGDPKTDQVKIGQLCNNEVAGTQDVHAMTRSPVQAQDHVLSERKRREKLNRHFINMSSLLPNLKKMDKASVLEDAVSYIRELQDRVKELEGITSVVKEKDSNKCVIGFKRCRVGKGNGNDNNDESSSNETQSAYKARESSSEIDVRMLGSNVLVTMYLPTNSTCVLVEAISKMQKLGLSIISTSATPFATTTTLITIVAQIEDDKFMTAKDLVRNLQLVV